MNRDEYIAWVKKRALGWLDAGKSNIALLVMQQGIEDYPQFGCAWYLEKGQFLYQAGMLSTPEQVREYIEALQ